MTTKEGESLNLEQSQKKETTEKTKHESWIIKPLLITALYAFFILSGLLEEKQYKKQYPSKTGNGSSIQLRHPAVSIFMVSIVTSIISTIGYLMTKHNIKHNEVTPFSSFDRPLLGIYYIVAKYSAESSIQYVDFIIKVIGKSCKSASSKIYN